MLGRPRACSLTGRLPSLVLAVAIVGCGGGEGGQGTGGTGGNQTTGTGGTIGTGGATGTGGNVSTGGSGPATGGQSGAGGKTNSGTGGTGGGTAGAAGTIGGGTGGSGGTSSGGHGGAGTGGLTGTGGMAGASGAAGKGGIGGSTAGSGGAGGHGGAVGSGGVSGGGTTGAAGMSGTQYMPCPATAGTACAILPLGDSITEGWLPTGGVGGYRVELFSKAVLAGKNITFFGSQTSSMAPSTVQNQTFPNKHEGHDGYTIDTGGGNNGISGSITDQAISNYHPSIVLLMIGTNDVNGNIDVTNAPTRLGKLIDEITTDSPTALVVVASIIPINGTNNKNAMTYNAAIPGLVSTRASAGKHVIFVDNYAAFIKDANYTTTEMSNYLHPNTAGYALLGDSFFGAISAHLP